MSDEQRSRRSRNPARATGEPEQPVRLAFTRTPGPKVRAVATIEVDADHAVRALEFLSEWPDSEPNVLIHVKPGMLEISRHELGTGYWETAVVPADVEQAAHTDAVVAQAVADDLHEALAGSVLEPGQRRTLVVDVRGAVHVDGVKLAPPAAPEAAAMPPPRPMPNSVLKQRIRLPATALAGVAMRLDGPNLFVPEPIRHRFAHRGVSLTSVFEHDGTWYMSGVVDGRPLLVLVGAVGVY